MTIEAAVENIAYAILFGLILGMVMGMMMFRVWFNTDVLEKDDKAKKWEKREQDVKAAVNLRSETWFSHSCKCQVPVPSTYVRICRLCNHHYPEQVVMWLWVLIPFAVGFLSIGLSKTASGIVHSIVHGNYSDEDVASLQHLLTHIATGWFGMIVFIMYLWSLPSVAKRMANKFEKRRHKENRHTLTTAEAYLSAYLNDLKLEDERRARTLRNDQCFDNIGLQCWFQALLNILPFIPCFLGGEIFLCIFTGLLLLDTISGCRTLRWFFSLTLGTNTVLNINDMNMKVSLVDPPAVEKVLDVPVVPRTQD